MDITYQTTAFSSGGRSGTVTVDGGALKFDMVPPAEMNGTKSGTNPEQLFAAAYAACFGGAMHHVVRVRKLHVPAPDVEVTIGLGRNAAGNNQLEAHIVAIIQGVDQATADELVQEAHAICPYSNATRGNIEVIVSAKVK